MTAYSIRIPEDAYPGLIEILSLNDEEFQILVKAMRNSEPTFYPLKFADEVSVKANLPIEVAREIADFVIPLFAVRYDMGITIPQFVETFVNAMGKLPSELDLPENAKALTEGRLPDLLSLERPLGIVSKSGTIAYQNERNFTESQVFTELRPIFGDDPEELPVAGVILHRLRINYVEDSKSREFFVTMDSNDIENLRKALDRADKKARSLRSLLGATTMHVLEMGTDD